MNTENETGQLASEPGLAAPWTRPKHSIEDLPSLEAKSPAQACSENVNRGAVQLIPPFAPDDTDRVLEPVRGFQCPAVEANYETTIEARPNLDNSTPASQEMPPSSPDLTEDSIKPVDSHSGPSVLCANGLVKPTTSEEDVTYNQGKLHDQGLGHKFKSTLKHLLMHTLAICLLAIVILFVELSYSAEGLSNKNITLSSALKTNVSTTITIVRASQGVLSALVTYLLNESFTILKWSQISSSKGLSYLNLLALSPTTGASGSFSLIKSSMAQKVTKLWAFLRVLLFGLLWLSGLTLFFNTSLITVYDTSHSYEVTAGVGPFNGSLVQPFRDFLHSLAPKYPYETLPYTYFAAAYTLVMNPLISTVSEPIQCRDGDCASYLLSGGLMMVAPWVPQGYSDYPMIKISRVPSLQMDFTDSAHDTFQSVDCDDFGENGTSIGIRLCLAEDEPKTGTIRAGLFVCASGSTGGECHVATPAPNITTEVAFYTRHASVIAARSNYSIVSITETTPPRQVSSAELDLPAYRDSLRWLLNYTAADLPPPSSIAQSFWSSQKQLRDISTHGIIAQNFQSVLAFPFWLFNSNNWGNTQLQENKTISSLPPDFYTTAYLVAPHSKIKFDFAMFIVFLVLQSLAISFAFGVTVWVWAGSGVHLKSSSFPLHDLWAKAEIGKADEKVGLLTAKNSKIIEGMKEARVFRR